MTSGHYSAWESGQLGRKLKIDNSGQARLVEISLVNIQYLLGENFVRTRAWPWKSDGQGSNHGSATYCLQT